MRAMQLLLPGPPRSDASREAVRCPGSAGALPLPTRHQPTAAGQRETDDDLADRRG